MDYFTQVLLACIAMVTAVFAYLAQRNSKRANDSVNSIGPQKHRLYDLVFHIGERIDRVDAWMIRHRNEADTIHDQLAAVVVGLEKVTSNLSVVATELDLQIRRFGCPVRLGIGMPLCGAKITHVGSVLDGNDQVEVKMTTSADKGIADILKKLQDDASEVAAIVDKVK